MPRFRKRPVEVEARQLTAPNVSYAWNEIAVWCTSPSYRFNGDPHMIVSTLHGDVAATEGDWIVRGPSGDFWPVEPDIFAESYELINDDAS